MRIPLAEFVHSVPFCQGVSAVLPRGTNIGYVSVLGLRFVFAIIREGKIPKAFKVGLRLFLESLGDYCERDKRYPPLGNPLAKTPFFATITVDYQQTTLYNDSRLPPGNGAVKREQSQII